MCLSCNGHKIKYLILYIIWNEYPIIATVIGPTDVKFGNSAYHNSHITWLDVFIQQD